ncbi:OmpP1/FadL family transporter [Thalassobius sp. Cn5-15]|uniref:OmpP1/FadL family transporter n=1 Tax=Thalassobius sp. Cn5-15 TaxID=2917763 RepID=UPI001EF2D076|nr:outer membrane protein transport protein [Thalassobius sp. Cn5-15]MCG7492121.1 outer membrane protein transport protein [Thalassobius sp. Cn5-15]
MNKFLAGVAVATLTAGAVHAGGIDRTGQGISFMFEEGNVVDLRFGSISPNVSGSVGGGALGTGNITEDYTQVAIGYKQQLNDKISLGILFDQPFGSDVSYPTGTGYPLAGTTATVDSNAITAVLRYRINDNVAVHGGVRALRTEGEITGLPTRGGIYRLNTDTQTDYGFLVGATYEIPDIALRAALTFNSEIKHDFNVEEQFGTGTVFNTDLEIRKPKSVNFDFQTGIAPGTLLLASARWVEWTVFDITPQTLGANLASYDSNTVSYTLGLGRRLNDKLSLSAVAGYEKSTDDLTGNLGPTDGFTSLTIAARYSLTEKTNLTLGVRRVWLGDATTRAPVSGEFTDNTANAVGLQLTHRF